MPIAHFFTLTMIAVLTVVEFNRDQGYADLISLAYFSSIIY